MSTESVFHPSIMAKNVIIIRLGPDGKFIIIEDEDGKGGGNVLSSAGRRIMWINATGYTCELKFRQLVPDDVSGDGDPAWPFVPPPGPADCVVKIPDAPGGKLSWGGTLRPKGEVNIFKYDVVLSATDGRTPPPPIDPVIIIER